MFCTMKDIPTAVISTASRGAWRNLRYARNSIAALIVDMVLVFPQRAGTHPGTARAAA